MTTLCCLSHLVSSFIGLCPWRQGHFSRTLKKTGKFREVLLFNIPVLVADWFGYEL